MYVFHRISTNPQNDNVDFNLRFPQCLCGNQVRFPLSTFHIKRNLFCTFLGGYIAQLTDLYSIANCAI